ncbi:DUF2179 domain-containing protein [Metamycoplasma buccale]|uniref:DUF2179 domain-containing protein n=1 Tax=Metamycoplasma buccale TaxID=55602 RepID=UPI00398E45DA
MDDNQTKENNKKTVDLKYEIDRIKVNDSLLHFSTLHRVKKMSHQIVLTTLIAIVFSFFGMLFVQNTGLYGFGVDAISHGFGRLSGFLVWHYSKNENVARITFVVLFWLVNFIINIPLFIFAAKKINKNFALLTFVFMLVSTISGIIFGFIPGSENWYIFSRPLNKEIWDKSKKIVQTSLWSYNDDAIKHVAVIFYGFLWAIIQGAIAAALLILNSSTAGFDILVVWYAREKFKNLGLIYIIFHIISLIFSNFIGTYIPASITINELPGEKIGDVNSWAAELLFNPNFASSFLMILINGFVVDILFPKYKMVKLEIYTSKIDEIQTKIYSLKDKRFATSIATVKGGYSKKEQAILIANCFYIDAATVCKIVADEDDNAFISIYDTKKTLGHVFVSKQVNKSKDNNNIKK